MLQRILKVLAGLGAAFSALFYVLMKQAKDEQKIEHAEARAEKAEQTAETVQEVHEAEKAVVEKLMEEKKEDEKLVEKVHSGDSLESFDAGLDLLRKQAERGSKRNTRSGESG